MALDQDTLVAALRRAAAALTDVMALHGEGLEVANWHRNGDLEALDNFLDELDVQGALEDIERVLEIMSLQQSVGRWLKEITTDGQLFDELSFLLSTNEQEIKDVQTSLCKPLRADDGNQLAKQLAWLDSYLYRLASLHADANTLLDLAEKFYLVPVGQMRPCTLPDGSQDSPGLAAAEAKIELVRKRLAIWDAWGGYFRDCATEIRATLQGETP